MRNEQLRKRLLEFVGSSREDLRAFPEDVKDAIGDALLEVPWGSPPDSAKPMHGWGSGVWEIVDNYHTDAYRAVYVVRFAAAVHVLHCFQKKSHRGRELPKPDRELIEKRLKHLESLHRGR